MGRNLFTYALLGGISSGADALARGMESERRMEQELAMRKALQDDQQAALLERAGLRGGVGGVGGTSGARVAAPAMTAEQAVADANTISQMPTREEIAKLYPDAPTQVDPAEYADGAALPEGQAGPTRPGYTDADGKPLPTRRMLDDAFFKEKAEKLVAMRERFYAGPNADKFASAAQTQTETNLLENAAKGDRKAGEGLLYNKGKDPQETVARAEAQKAEADKDRRTDPNARRGPAPKPDAGPKPPSGIDVQRATTAAMDAAATALGVTRQELNGEIARREKSGKLTPEQTAAIARLRAAQQRQAELVPSKAPAAGPAPAQSGDRRGLFQVVR